MVNSFKQTRGAAGGGVAKRKASAYTGVFGMTARPGAGAAVQRAGTNDRPRSVHV